MSKTQSAPSCLSPRWGEASWGEEAKRDNPISAAGSVSSSWQGMCAEEQRKERQGRCLPSLPNHPTVHSPLGCTAQTCACTHPSPALISRGWGQALLLLVASPCLHTQ